MSLPAIAGHAWGRAALEIDVTPLKSGLQCKPFIYLNRAGHLAGVQEEGPAFKKSPAFRRDFPFPRCGGELASLAGILLLLPRLVAAALLLAGLLTRLLVLLTRILALLARVLVWVGHSGSPC